MPRYGRFLVSGANGGLGRQIISALGGFNAIAITRRACSTIYGRPNLYAENLDDISKLEFSPNDLIINAAGLVSGHSGDMEMANLMYPIELAKHAKNSGVRRFVHISSFAVYGEATMLNKHTAEAPCNRYGRLKKSADSALMAMRSDSFNVSILRLPFLFSASHPGLIRPLIKFTLATNRIISQDPPALRSMMTLYDAANLAVDVAQAEHSGIILAADPLPFSFEVFGCIVQDVTSRKLKVVKVPGPLQKMLKFFLPNVHKRLFSASLLQQSANFVLTEDVRHMQTGLGIEKEIYNTLIELTRK